MKYDRFEHEQQIMSCWNICDELKELSIGILEHDMTPDQVTNVIMGLEELYRLKFTRLFDQFELSIRDTK